MGSRVCKCIHIMHRISISSQHHNEHVIFQHHILHESLHHHAYAFNILVVLQTAYLLFSCSLMRDPCIFLYKTKTKKGGSMKIHDTFLVAYIFSTMSQPWWDHKPVSLKKKKQNKKQNAWLTRKWYFFGHLNFIITFFMHRSTVCPSH